MLGIHIGAYLCVAFLVVLGLLSVHHSDKKQANQSHKDK